MSYLIGIGLSLLVAVFARWAGLDRDRGFYPTVLIVVALYYVLFAVMGGSTRALVLESMVMAVFAALAVVGFKHSLWLAVAGLAGHGVMDFFHAHLVTNPGVPSWWPGFCLGYDVGAAACLAWLIKARNEHAPTRLAPVRGEQDSAISSGDLRRASGPSWPPCRARVFPALRGSRIFPPGPWRCSGGAC